MVLGAVSCRLDKQDQEPATGINPPDADATLSYIGEYEVHTIVVRNCIYVAYKFRYDQAGLIHYEGCQNPEHYDDSAHK